LSKWRFFVYFVYFYQAGVFASPSVVLAAGGGCRTRVLQVACSHGATRPFS
jgi:hypothetical protein